MTKSSTFSKSQLDMLKQAKKQLAQSNAPLPHTTPTQHHEKKMEDIDENLMFQKAMQGVTPIKNDNIAIIQKSKKKPDERTLAKRISAEGTDINTSSTELSDTQALLNPVASQAFLTYRIATLQNRIFDQLKAGKLRWYDTVDLHGCTMEQAREAVLKIIQIAQDDNQTVVKIVHGKGDNGILKTCVNGWLRQHKDVLAFVSAPENQGGTGAVLVLLKRSENSKNQNER